MSDLPENVRKSLEVAETKRKLGIVFNLKCYHPKEDKEYQCKTIEESQLEYQGYRCPKCGHEIWMQIQQHYLSSEDLKEKEKTR